MDKKGLRTAALHEGLPPIEPGTGGADQEDYSGQNTFFAFPRARITVLPGEFLHRLQVPAGSGNRKIPWLAMSLVVITLFCLAALPVSGSVDGQPAMVTSYSVNPPVLSPGGLGTITLVIQQIGKTTLSERMSLGTGSYMNWAWTDSVNIEHITLEENGLVVLSPDYDRLGQIGPDKSLRVTFVVRAPTKSGIYYPEVWMNTDAGSSRFPIPVNVNTAIGTQKQAVIIMQSSLPDSVNVGDEIPVRITLRNEGGTLADKLTVKIGNASTVIAPKTTNLYYLGTINPDEEKSLDLVLLSDRDADPGLVNVPVTIQYNLIDGKVLSETESINLIMKGVGEMRFASAETNPEKIFENQPFDITLWFENTGTGEARQVEATIDLLMAGTKVSDLGKITPGDDASAVFLINGGREGIYTYNATITYVDDIGTHTKVRQHSLRVTRDIPTTIMYPVLLLIIIGGVLVFLYWYRRQEKG
jgi:hypothetical protein